MFLRAARSMAAFVGWCDGGSTDDGCAAASMDETTISALHLLHQHDYDTGKALQALVKVINPKSVDKRWSDDDVKKFVRGLKQHGKNFFKIRRDLLQNKETAQLVEYYYLWKKTPAASTTRPHRRHRRPALRRQAPTPTLPSNEELEDMSSTSDILSENESDEENDPHVANTCCDCSATKSARWYEHGKDGDVVCATCVRKYNGSTDGHLGEVVDDQNEPPPFMFRPVKEDHQELEWKQGMTKHDVEDDSYRTTKHEAVHSVEDRTSPSGDSSCGASVASMLDTAKDADAMEPPMNIHPQVLKLSISPDSNIVKDAGTLTTSPSDTLIIAEGNSAFVGNSSSISVSQDGLGSAFTVHGDRQFRDTPPAQPEVTREVTKTAGFTSENWRSVENPAEKSVERPVVNGCLDENRPRYGDESAPWYQFPQLDAYNSLNSSFGVKSDGLSGSTDYTYQMLSPCIKTEHSVEADTQSSADCRKWPPVPDTLASSDCGKWEMPQFPHLWDNTDAESGQSARTDLDGKPLRAVASVAPTQVPPSMLSEEAASAEGQGLPSSQCPPPLVPLRLSPSCGDSQSNDYQYDSTSRQFPQPDVNRDLLFGGCMPTSMPPTLTEAPRSPGFRVDSESETEQDNIRRTPSPEPQPTNIECYRSTNAIFMKCWHRGNNSCSRSDLEFVPLPNSALVRRREERAAAKALQSVAGGSGHKSSAQASGAPVSVVKDGRKVESSKSRSDFDEKKKVNSPPENRSSDAQITSSLMGNSHHVPMFAPNERMTPRSQFPLGHDPTPALRQLSEYARPHIGGSGSSSGSRELQRGCVPPYGVPGLPPSHNMDPFFRMPGVYPPGSREALEMEMERDKREREAWERELRDIRELEFMEKMKQEMELKLPGFDRLGAAAAASQLDPLWIAELQRRYVTSGGPPPPPGHIPGIFPPGNLAADLMRERERIDRMEMARSSQEQQQQLAAAVAARDNGALYQLYQRYAHDPATLQRQLSAYLAMSASKAHDSDVARMMDASHLVYHFARADPMSGAGPSAAQGAPPPSLGPSPIAPPPPPLPGHAMPPSGMSGHPLIAAAREQERIYMELMSRPPYSTDPMLAQQLMVQAAAQQEAIQRQLALERECLGGGPLAGSSLLH